MRITVFTPTYNRGYTIERLYNSLKEQTFQEFEWIVVDDGSSDETGAIFERICKDKNFFPIQYIKTTNGGKHRAINLGVKMAKGELFYIVDSDDYVPTDALEVIDAMERTIPEESKELFAGVCGERGYDLQTPIGKTHNNKILDITSLERMKYGVEGDKAEVFYTALLRRYPFPEFEGEKFVTECVIWDRIANDGYKLRFFNNIVMVCNYLPDGLTAKGKRLLLDNPMGYGLYLHQSIQYGKLTGIRKWNELLDYYIAQKQRFNFLTIAHFLYSNPIKLWFRIMGLRIFYKLYGRY